MIVFCFEIELWTSKLNKKGASAVSKVAYVALYLALYFIVGFTFYYLRFFSFGMEGPKENWKHTQWLQSWRVSDDNYV